MTEPRPIRGVPGTRRRPMMLGIAVVIAATLACCSGSGARTMVEASGKGLGFMNMEFRLRSPVFQDNGRIPREYSCEGNDTSPPLQWSGTPAGTQSLALIVADFDAPSGPFTHWIIWAIPAQAQGLQAGIEGEERLASGEIQGTNSFHRLGYGGPCPPAGRPHHYVFTLYALKAVPKIDPGAETKAFQAAIRSNVIAAAELTGLYQRGD